MRPYRPGLAIPATCILLMPPQAGCLIFTPQFSCLQNGANSTHFTGSLRSKPHLPGDKTREVRIHTCERPLSLSGLCVPGPQQCPPIPSPFCFSHPHQNEPRRAGGLRELKHAIEQLLDGKRFGNFRLHLLLNLILSSDAHYVRDGISCGLPSAPHTSRRHPASRWLLMSLPAT